MERAASKAPSTFRSTTYERPEKYESDSGVNELERYEQENRELRLKISRLESDLAEKEVELNRLRSQKPGIDSKFDKTDIERYRAAQLQAERLLEAREQSHRQQVARLENQVSKRTMSMQRLAKQSGPFPIVWKLVVPTSKK